MSKKILVTGVALPEAHQAMLASQGYLVKVERSDLTEKELIDSLKGVSAYLLGGVEKANEEVINASSELEIIAFFGVGYESYVDLNAATKKGIAVTNTPQANARSVAEFTMALMLDAVKRTTYVIEGARQGKWIEEKSWNLSGRTLAIIGMGTIGQQVAKIARHGFGMKIIYTGKTRKPEIEETLEARFTELPDLLEKADVLSLHASINEHTRGIIDEKAFDLMKPHAVLINTSRAELVDGKSLKQALMNSKLACAAFDGYYIEPVPAPDKDPFGLLKLSTRQFLVSPHTAYFTEDATQAMADMATNSILSKLKGEQPANLVNPEYKN